MTKMEIKGVWIPTWFSPKNSKVTLSAGSVVFANETDCQKWIDQNSIHPEQYKCIYRPIIY